MAAPCRPHLPRADGAKHNGFSVDTADPTLFNWSDHLTRTSPSHSRGGAGWAPIYGGYPCEI
jgi:hypothetical protein